MRIAVCVKNAVDETELKISPAGAPALEGAATKMSTFDKNAVEEAMRMKGAAGGEVVVFSVGPDDSKKTIKEALAMGADKGIHVSAGLGTLDSLGTARVLAAAIKRVGGFDVVLCSEGSSDTYTGLVPPMLGEALALPYVGYARKIELGKDAARIERSLEESIELVECSIPFVASVVSEINAPRYPTLIQIMQASKKPIEEIALADLGPAGISGGNASVLSMTGQSMARKRIVYEGSADEAVDKLIQALAS
ncbi:MAG: electron transfer flavoprotein subunit beta/FixA family protein, partial [Nitrososphaerota archaeon]|nr:electron transfer flavoprotein subunit beta/FixA family protein [Nitrososphaerota archaeon]